MRIALTLDQASAREGWGLKWIFVRQRCSRAETDTTASAPLGTLTPFGTLEQPAFGLGLMGKGADDAARALHEAYRRFAPNDVTAALALVPDELREATRVRLQHLSAKLASIQFDCPATAILMNLADALADPVRLELLAETEHERWMVQRRLNGCRYGPLRDNARRLHQNLVPYDRSPRQPRRRIAKCSGPLPMF